MNRETGRLLIVLAVLVLLVLLMPALGISMLVPGMMSGFGQHRSPGWSWGLGMGLGLLAMLAFWGTLIVGAALLVRWLGGPRSGGESRGEPPIETLKRRYAAGEIDREEYERMRQELER